MLLRYMNSLETDLLILYGNAIRDRFRFLDLTQYTQNN